MSELSKTMLSLAKTRSEWASSDDRCRDAHTQGVPAHPLISVVVPCFNEAAVLPELDRRLVASCREVCGETYEIIFVDDGSRDDTWNVIRSLADLDHNVVAARLMRNHGHQFAVSAGLAFAHAERVLLIDADLQDPPELLGPMMKVMDEEEADVVFGQRVARAGETRFKTASATAFYRVLARLTDVPIPVDTGDFRLMRRRIVDALTAMPERHRFIRGMVCWVGGKQVPFPYERQARFAGTTHYPLGRMLRFALDALTGFSTAPLRLATWCGFGCAVVAMLFLGMTLWSWATRDTVVGWTSIMTAVTFLGAVQLTVLGIIGEYLGRLFQEAKQRPLFLLDQVMAGGRVLSLPPEFASERSDMRREIWQAASRATDQQIADAGSREQVGARDARVSAIST